MRLARALFVLLLVCAGSAPAQQQNAAQTSVPHLVQFNGVLTDAATRPVAGVSSVTFAVYAEQQGGAALWSETQNILADSNGHYSIVLGAATTGGFPVELFGTGQSRWLGVSIARQPEMPRILMASVPYALKAGDADTLGGLPASSYVTAQQLAASSARDESTIVASPGVLTTTAAPLAAANAEAAQSSVIQAAPTGSGTTDYVPLWTSGSNLGNSILFQTGGKLGIGTTTPAATFDLNGGEILRGGFYEYPQGTATASAGQPSHSFQWSASVFDSSTNAPVYRAFGFRAVPQNNNTSNPAASLDLFYGTGGPDGSLNDLGLSINNTGVISFVPGQTFAGAAFSASGPVDLGVNSGIQVNGVQIVGTGLVGGALANTVIGAASLAANTTGFGNTAIGLDAMQSNTSGYESTAVGEGALLSMTTGCCNTALGEGALIDTTGGGNNTAVGASTLSENVDGTYNTGIGFEAGGFRDGVNDTYVGSFAVASINALSNATAIGANSVIGESNAIVLGSITGVNDATSSVNVGIGTSTPGYALEVHDSDIGPGTSAIIGATHYVGHNGVLGAATATSGSSNGGYFTTASPQGAGLVATNTGGGLVASLQGNVQITGTLTKGGGSFKIDDPIDPANKYLSHSFVESPDMMNIYNGNVTTNAKGYATITLPDWFSALNRDFRYQLTVVGQFAQAIVATEINDNRFTIRTNKPRVKVSWQVTGIRQDAWANAHRIPTEEEKPANEQGRYLHPELFGAGPEKSVNATTTGTVSLDAAKTFPVPVTQGGTR